MERFWVLLPAAGTGRRMQSTIPKQYMQMNGMVVIEHTIRRMRAVAGVEGIFVVINPADQRWQTLELDDLVRVVRAGRDRRAGSVSAGLEFMLEQPDVSDDDWVLVHDSVRCCLLPEMVERLMDVATREGGEGGLLAAPLNDTIKLADDDQRSCRTPDRSRYWLAQTPQMFRIRALLEALRQAEASGVEVTDEASAMEMVGARPLLVANSADNLKITRPEDLALAASIQLRQDFD